MKKRKLKFFLQSLEVVHDETQVKSFRQIFRPGFTERPHEITSDRPSSSDIKSIRRILVLKNTQWIFSSANIRSFFIAQKYAYMIHKRPRIKKHPRNTNPTSHKMQHKNGKNAFNFYNSTKISFLALLFTITPKLFLRPRNQRYLITHAIFFLQDAEMSKWN